MRLDAYLTAQRITSKEFAELARLGNKQTVHNYRHGLRFPTPENLDRIQRATNGAVTASDFIEHVRERRAVGVATPPSAEAAA